MIKFVDMFSGIGGFREGLTRAGGFECVGHCEIDKYANRSYNALFDTKGEWFIEDVQFDFRLWRSLVFHKWPLCLWNQI